MNCFPSTSCTLAAERLPSWPRPVGALPNSLLGPCGGWRDSPFLCPLWLPKSLKDVHVSASSYYSPKGYPVLWNSAFPWVENFHIWGIWENGRAGKGTRKIISREVQYSFLKDQLSLRRRGSREAVTETSASTSARSLPEPAGWCMAAGRQLSDSHLSQLMLKMTPLQSLGFPPDLH